MPDLSGLYLGWRQQTASHSCDSGFYGFKFCFQVQLVPPLRHGAVQLQQLHRLAGESAHQLRAAPRGGEAVHKLSSVVSHIA